MIGLTTHVTAWSQVCAVLVSNACVRIRCTQGCYCLYTGPNIHTPLYLDTKVHVYAEINDYGCITRQ